MAIPDELDREKLAEAALGLLWLGAHGDKEAKRVWKTLDWDVMDLLHHKGWIGNPKSKARSVALTEKGAQLAEKFLEKHFRARGSLNSPP